MVGFIQSSSDPSQPSKALDKKNSKITQFLYVFIICLITKFGENFEVKIDICFLKNVLVEKWKSKSLTHSRDFYPDPPNNEKLKFSG